MLISTSTNTHPSWYLATMQENSEQKERLRLQGEQIITLQHHIEVLEEHLQNQEKALAETRTNYRTVLLQKAEVEYRLLFQQHCSELQAKSQASLEELQALKEELQPKTALYSVECDSVGCSRRTWTHLAMKKSPCITCQSLEHHEPSTVEPFHAILADYTSFKKVILDRKKADDEASIMPLLKEWENPRINSLGYSRELQKDLHNFSRKDFVESMCKKLKNIDFITVLLAAHDVYATSKRDDQLEEKANVLNVVETKADLTKFIHDIMGELQAQPASTAVIPFKSPNHYVLLEFCKTSRGYDVIVYNTGSQVELFHCKAKKSGSDQLCYYPITYQGIREDQLSSLLDHLLELQAPTYAGADPLKDMYHTLGATAQTICKLPSSDRPLLLAYRCQCFGTCQESARLAWIRQVFAREENGATLFTQFKAHRLTQIVQKASAVLSSPTEDSKINLSEKEIRVLLHIANKSLEARQKKTAANNAAWPHYEKEQKGPMRKVAARIFGFFRGLLRR